MQILLPACSTAPAFLVTQQPFECITSQSEFKQNNRNIFSYSLLLYNPIIINNSVIGYSSQGSVREMHGFAFRIREINPCGPWVPGSSLSFVALGGCAALGSAARELVWAGSDNPPARLVLPAHVDRCPMRLRLRPPGRLEPFPAQPRPACCRWASREQPAPTSRTRSQPDMRLPGAVT